MEEKRIITYTELRDIALKNNIADNKVSIGLWAKFMGYKKRRIQDEGKVYIYYLIPTCA